VVGGLPGNREQPEKAGDIDDVAVPGGDEVRQKSLGAVDNSPEVDVHHPFDVFERGDVDVTRVGDAGVVVDLVDLAVVVLDRVGVDLEGLAFGDVEAVTAHRSANGFELLLGGGVPVEVDVAD